MSSNTLEKLSQGHYLVQLIHRIPTLKAPGSVRLSPHRLEDLRSSSGTLVKVEVTTAPQVSSELHPVHFPTRAHTTYTSKR